MKKDNYLYNALNGQYTTEKSTFLLDKCNCITFKVSNGYNKNEIKKAVEKIFNVIVISVNVINVKGKTIKFKNVTGKKKNWKKAFVFLKKGYGINFSEFK